MIDSRRWNVGIGCDGQQTTEHTGHRGGDPGAKIKITPVRSPPTTQESSLLRLWPAMRAHPTWQRPLDVTSLFFSSQAPRLLHGSYLAATSDLLGLIIIEFHPNNYYKESSSSSSHEVEKPGPPEDAGKAPSSSAAASARDTRSAARQQISNGSESPKGRSESSVRRSRRLASRFKIEATPNASLHGRNLRTR